MSEIEVLVIEPEQHGAATVWRYGERVAAAFGRLSDGCELCTSDIICYRHVGTTLDVDFVGYQGLRIETEHGEMADCGVAMGRDCVGCGAIGQGGSLVVSPRGMLASARDSCIERAALSGRREATDG